MNISRILGFLAFLTIPLPALSETISINVSGFVTSDAFHSYDTLGLFGSSPGSVTGDPFSMQFKFDLDKASYTTDLTGISEVYGGSRYGTSNIGDASITINGYTYKIDGGYQGYASITPTGGLILGSAVAISSNYDQISVGTVSSPELPAYINYNADNVPIFSSADAVFMASRQSLYSLQRDVINLSPRFISLNTVGSTIHGGAVNDPILPSGETNGDGSFYFSFSPVRDRPTYVDPSYAVGYTFRIANGDNKILRGIFPSLSFDKDGYDVYTLGGDLLASGVMEYDSGATGVDGFILKGIDYTANAGVESTDSLGFVTGLVYLNGNAQTTIQTPMLVNGASSAPEVGTWTLFIIGFASIGAFIRLRRTTLLGSSRLTSKVAPAVLG